MPGDLTDRQERVLIEIGKHVRDRGIAPTVREVMAATGISSTSVTTYHMRRVERAGYIRRSAVLSRGITITGAGGAWLARRGIYVAAAPDRTHTAAIEEAARLVVMSPTQAHLRALGRALEAVAS